MDNEQATINDYNEKLLVLRSQMKCVDTVGKASDLVGVEPFKIDPVQLANNGTTISIPLDQAIDRAGLDAQTTLADLTDNLEPGCKQKAKLTIDLDSAFLAAIAHGSTGVPAAADQWRAQLSALRSVNTNLATAQAGVQVILANRQNFTIDTQIHGNQQAITVKVSCSPVPMQGIIPASTVSAATKATTPTNPPTAADNTKAATASNEWSREFRFSPGPRFALAGGLVISPLSSVTFSTSANPAGSSGTAKAPANIVTLQQNSSTRILPIAMLHGRFWDQLPPGPLDWLPNYLSAGVTAKSDAPKGTSVEFLFGPSWAFAARQLFVTAGAYAGQQQRLDGGLEVGKATNLGTANLPITQKTIWKAGFAITWAPAGK